MDPSDIIVGLLMFLFITVPLASVFVRVKYARQAMAIIEEKVRKGDPIISMNQTDPTGLKKAHIVALIFSASAFVIASLMFFMRTESIYWLLMLLYSFTFLHCDIVNHRFFSLSKEKRKYMDGYQMKLLYLDLSLCAVLIILANTRIEIAQQYLLHFLFIFLVPMWMIVGIRYWVIFKNRSN